MVVGMRGWGAAPAVPAAKHSFVSLITPVPAPQPSTAPAAQRHRRGSLPRPRACVTKFRLSKARFHTRAL